MKANKGAGYQIQNDIINGIDEEGENDHQYNKSIKLITEENEHVLKQSHIYLLLLAFLTLFSILSIATFTLSITNIYLYSHLIKVNEMSH